MLGNEFFFHDLFKKYIYVFGHIFNDIYINRKSDDNSISQKIKVPVSYGDKDKILSKNEFDRNDELDRINSFTVPRIVFHLENAVYDNSRNLNRVQKYVSTSNSSTMKTIYNQIPYEINFKVYIISNNQEDLFKIIEQIIPFFAPSFTFSVELIPELNITLDCPVDLSSSINFNNIYQGDINNKQYLFFDLDFKMKAFFFGPIKKSGLIKFTTTNLYLPKVEDSELYKAVGNSSSAVSIDIRPGLTANGEPTSNAQNSLPISQIEADDKYGYIITINDNN